MVNRNVLSKTDAARLEGLEKVVRGGLQTFAEVAAALMTIRDDGLYKQYASTFDAYVQLRFEISRSYAYRYIAAAETVKLLGSGDSPIGDSLAAGMADNEATLRPIASLPPEERVPAAKEAAKLAKAEGATKITSRHTNAAVKARRAEKRAEAKTASAVQAATATGTATDGASDDVSVPGANKADAEVEVPERGKVEASEPTESSTGYVPEVGVPTGTDASSDVTPAVREVERPTPAEWNETTRLLIRLAKACPEPVRGVTADYRAAGVAIGREGLAEMKEFHLWLGGFLLQAEIGLVEAAAAKPEMQESAA